MESNKWLGNNQTRGRNAFSVFETATISELIVETHKLTKFSLCIDRIIRSHAILNSRKFGIPDNICKVYSIAHDLIKFRTQMNITISKKSYSSTKTLTYYGVGQGTGNGGTKWTFISIPMMKVVENVSQGCIIKLPRSHKQ